MDYVYLGLKAAPAILLFKFLSTIILTEALTELAVKSEFFYPLRKFLFKSKSGLMNFIHQVFDCGYCFSVWAGMLSVVCLFYINNSLLNFLILGLVVHRLSNLLHYVMDKMKSNVE